jgi:hypothetical protein
MLNWYVLIILTTHRAGEFKLETYQQVVARIPARNKNDAEDIRASFPEGDWRHNRTDYTRRANVAVGIRDAAGKMIYLDSTTMDQIAEAVTDPQHIALAAE